MIDLVSVIVISLLPGFEGRYAVVYGLLKGLDPLLVTTVSMACTVILSVVLTLLVSTLDKMLNHLVLSNSSISKFVKYYLEHVNHVRNRINARIHKYGIFILVLFIAIPVPGTGVWTGALVAYLLKLRARQILISLISGGILSIIITASLYFFGKEVISILMR